MRHTLFPGLLASTALAVLMADTDAGSAIRTPAAEKSIVDPKYRGRKNEDWVAKLITDHATAYKEVVKKVDVEGSTEKAEVKEQKANGVDVDGLFKLAAVNNLDVAKFNDQRESHGFPGRFRMTVANMLRGAARNRHGLYAPGAEGEDPTWISAPADWLASSNPPAPKEPTQNPDGSKIVKAKPAKETEAAASEPATADA